MTSSLFSCLATSIDRHSRVNSSISVNIRKLRPSCVLLGPSSTTLLELAGTAAGQYDRLLVAGELEVSGALEVQLLDGFAPTSDTGFQIFAATDLSGEFSSLVLPDLLGNLSWDSSRLYSNGTLSVIPEPAPLSLLAVAMLMACRRRRRCG